VIRVDVLGVNAAVAKFLALVGATEKAVDAAEDRGGQAVLAGAEARVPVDTGALRDSLHTEEDPSGGTLVGTDIPYAVFVEYGTSDTPAQPFLRPALDAEQAEIAAGMALALNAAIRSVT
jgi:HK97 gp10 family phage protein